MLWYWTNRKYSWLIWNYWSVQRKINGLKDTAYRIAKTWFIEEEKTKYFYLCEEVGKQNSIEATDNGLITMKNWDGVKNLQNIKNETLIVWGDKDKAYNFNQVKHWMTIFLIVI